MRFEGNFAAMSETAKAKKILEGATEVFMRYGIKSVNMDDVARNLGISKKTLYKYVKDKADLLRQAFQAMHRQEEEVIGEICSRGLNAIDEMFEISQYILGLLNNLHPSVHFDMEKYYPELMKQVEDKRESTVFSCMLTNMNKGIKEGLYRKDLKPEVLARIYIHKIDAIFDGELFPPSEVSFGEVYIEFFRYHIRGIASEKGIAYLVEKMKQETKR